MTFMESARARVRGRGLRIAFPDGLDERALRGARLLADQGLAAPILLGAGEAIRARAASLGLRLDGVGLREPGRDPSHAAHSARYLELRRRKGLTPEEARARAALPHYFGALMVTAGEADGMVSGLASETKPWNANVLVFPDLARATSPTRSPSAWAGPRPSAQSSRAWRSPSTTCPAAARRRTSPTWP